jgi:hypothetical protein
MDLIFMMGYPVSFNPHPSLLTGEFQVLLAGDNYPGRSTTTILAGLT